jgi:predicted nucleic acid-binding protein
MVICDSGALIALLNAEDPAHTRCVEALQSLPAQPLLITVPSFVEAMYFLGKLEVSLSRTTFGHSGYRAR